MALTSETPEELLYPNQPLVEVASEIKFFGELTVETKRDLFYEEIRREYPHIYVPKYEPGVHPALQHYKFITEDKMSGVSLAMNSLSFYQRNYKGYKPYADELMRLFDLGDKFFQVRKLSRIGWRYINIMPFVRENNSVPLQRFFNAHPGFFAIGCEELENINFEFSSSCDDKTISVKLCSGENNTEDEAFLFDIDVSTTNLEGINNSDDIRDKVGELHSIGRNYFESAISDPYRKYLRGEYDE